MSTTTVRANARTLTDRDDPSELFRKFMEDLDETQLSPAFAALHREFRAAVEGEDAAFLAFDGTAPPWRARWEVWQRIHATEAVYVKDLAIRTAPLMWAMGRHKSRFRAEAEAQFDAHDAKKAGRLQ